MTDNSGKCITIHKRVEYKGRRWSDDLLYGRLCNPYDWGTTTTRFNSEVTCKSCLRIMEARGMVKHMEEWMKSGCDGHGGGMALTWDYLVGDCREVLKTLPEKSIQTCVTSPPYWGLRDYGVDNQLGLEPTPEMYVEHLTETFREVRRVLRDDGTLWLNLGDSYAGGGGSSGHTEDTKNLGRKTKSYGAVKTGGRTPSNLKPKDLVGIPWMVAFALRADGWYLRSDIIWSKPNPMPESVTDRPTKSHEYIFLLTKNKKYYYDADAVREPHTSDNTEPRACGKGNSAPGRNDRGTGREFFGNERGRNKRSVWVVTTKPYPEAHFATFPPDLIKPCILAGSRKGDTILDPFGGSGTTAEVSRSLGRSAILIDINPKYKELAVKRGKLDVPDIMSFKGD